jgi:L-galactose dehydrogenase
MINMVEYVDVGQIIRETLPAMRELQKAGKCRAIGISGYPLSIFRQLLDAMDKQGSSAPPLVDFVLCYARYGLHDQSLEQLGPELEKRGVGLIHASPLATGRYYRDVCSILSDLYRF